MRDQMRSCGYHGFEFITWSDSMQSNSSAVDPQPAKRPRNHLRLAALLIVIASAAIFGVVQYRKAQLSPEREMLRRDIEDLREQLLKAGETKR